jgi:hypothetical protein
MSSAHAVGFARRFKLSVTLEDSSNFLKWRRALQEQLFAKIRNTDMDRMVPTDTLDAKFFKTEFREEWKEASKDAGGSEQSPFNDAAFAELCFSRALKTGDGFEPWIYEVFAEVRNSLCDDIKEQTAGVALGDLVGLLKGINLALGHFETFDPVDLEILYSKCTMGAEGGNDLMRFTSVLAQHMRRLAAAGHAVTDVKAQRVLLRGLDQDIFESFITAADGRAYATYAKLEMAVKKFASKERVLAKLRELKPGVPHAVLTTRAKVMDADGRMDRMERILTAMADKQGGKRAPGPCFRFRDDGKCDRGDKCPFTHDSGGGGGGGNSSSRRNESRRNNTSSSSNSTGKWCLFHKKNNHNTEECHQLNTMHPELKAFYATKSHVPGSQQINAAYDAGEAAQGNQGLEQHRFENINVTRVSMPRHIFAMSGGTKVDMWCVDGASTTMATWDRGRCHNIRACTVSVEGPNSLDKGFVCTEQGDGYITAFDKATGGTVEILVHDVLINEAFPFHIFSEIKAFKAGSTATKREGAWQFYSSSGKPLLHASQRLLDTKGGGGVELYFVDEPTVPAAGRQVAACARGAMKGAHTIAAVRAATSVVPQPGLQAGMASDHGLPPLATAPDDNISPLANGLGSGVGRAPTLKVVSTKKNLELLLELHCSHGHRNFADIARQYGLSLPSPAPTCWACMQAKPRRITHDVVSTRITTRPFEGFAADAKGPIATPTPEGYRFFFVVLCLYSTVLWTFLTKSQKSWIDIWRIFVNKIEAKAGKQRCVAFIISDSHGVFTSAAYTSFNDERGIQALNTSPHSQWQDPAERPIQTLMNAARTNLIHGGGRQWMWGWSVKHAEDAVNRLEPSHPVKGHEGKSRIMIVDPSMTLEKSMRTLHPFLCLAFKTVPMAERGADFNPRADPCVQLRYDPLRKSYAMLTVPNLYLTHSVEVTVIAMCFPLRVTDHLTNQLDTFLRPSVEDNLYAHIHGPGNMLRRRPLASPAIDSTTLVDRAPVQVRAPLPGPGWSSSRGYMPSVDGLQSAASVNTAHVLTAPALYTPDQLAARTPKGTRQALTGPDRAYWLPAILKDHGVLRAEGCFKNITDIKPPGPPPPNVEQRFKIKYRGVAPIALAALQAEWWKARTVARGDRFKYGVHFDATAAPVIHAPALKMLLAWGVARGLIPYQWDQIAAFYGNKMDIEGVVVRLPVGFDPWADALRPLDLPPLYGELAKGVPGIPQGSLLQYRDIAPALFAMGFVPADADNCLFVHEAGNMATSLHVDDGVLFVPTAKHAADFFGPLGLGKTRKLTWGPLQSTLGIDFVVKYSEERRQIFMSQRPFAVTILERAGMLDCNPARTPAVPGRKYTKADCPDTAEAKAALQQQGLSRELYHTISASINFLVTITRDDMRFAQGKTSKYCLNPGPEHFLAQKHLLRFLQGTLGYGIDFVWHKSDPPPTDGPLDIVAWTDSSYADDVDTGRTTLGDVVKVNGATVSASSRLGVRVDSCVNHSELQAFAGVFAQTDDGVLTDGASEAMVRTGRTIVWLRGVKAALERRDVGKVPPTRVLVDNAGVLSMLEGATIKAPNKHIYKALAENRERVHLDKSVVAVKIDTKDNIANAMTKQEHGLRESAAQLRRITGPMLV